MCRVNAAGVYHTEGATVPLRLRVESVTRGAGRLVHNSEALTDQSIEKSAFAYVRTANESDKRFRHGSFVPRDLHPAQVQMKTPNGKRKV